MNTVLAVKLTLLPVVVFWVIAGFGFPALASAIGLATALVSVTVQRRLARATGFDYAVLGSLALVAAAQWLGVLTDARAAHALTDFALAGVALATVVAGRPWTSAYAARSMPQLAGQPLFLRINTVMSGLWAFAFAVLGAGQALGWPATAVWGPAVIGMVLSAIVPRFWVRHALARQIAAARPYRWASPLFPAARATPGPDVIVVGAGVGGLTAAGLLAREGVRVAVCEQYTMPGGFVHSWRRVLTLDGKRATFRFDGGMHDVSGLYPGGPVRAVLERLELFSPADWARLDHRFVRDGRAFDVPREWNHYVVALAALQPDAAPRAREVMDVIRAVFEGMYATGAKHGGIPGPLASAESMLAFAREHPLAVRWMQQPFDRLIAPVPPGPARTLLLGLSGYVTDRPDALVVRDVVPLFGYFLHGGHYPIGGSGAISQRIARRIVADGGTVRLGTPVERVIVEADAVRGVRPVAPIAGGAPFRGEARCRRGLSHAPRVATLEPGPA